MELQKKRDLKDAFNDIPLKKREPFYRHVRMILKVLVKACKMLERYPASDPTFDDIIDNFIESVGKVTNQMPVTFITTKKVGFYYCEKKIKLMDSGEKMFRSIFLVNNIRELFVTDGVTRDDVRNFFRVIRKTADYTGKDYSFESLLWDYGIESIGTISFADMGEFQPPGPSEFKHGTTPERALSDLPFVELADMVSLIRDFDGIDATESDNFKEFRELHGAPFVLRKYLRRQRTLIAGDGQEQMRTDLFNQFIQFTRDLFKEARFVYAVTYFKELQVLVDDLVAGNRELHEQAEALVSQINSEKFISRLFDVAVTLTRPQIEAFGEFLTMISDEHFDTIFSLLVEHDDKDVRMHCLRGVARNFNNYETAKKLLTHETWYYVRNALYILRFAKNDEFLPLIRNVMNHEKKQIRVEAAEVLSMYDADENLPFWEKAVRSPDIEVRELSVQNLVKVKNMEAKRILDTVFRLSNLTEMDETELLDLIQIVIDSKRTDMYDLIGNLLFFEKKEIRMAVIRILTAVTNPEPIMFHLQKKVRDNEFMELDRDEIQAFMQLITPSTHTAVLPRLERIFDLSGPLFKRGKYRKKKQDIFQYLASQKKTNALQHWFRKAARAGNKGTKSILKEIGVS